MNCNPLHIKLNDNKGCIPLCLTYYDKDNFYSPLCLTCNHGDVCCSPLYCSMKDGPVTCTSNLCIIHNVYSNTETNTEFECSMLMCCYGKTIDVNKNINTCNAFFPFCMGCSQNAIIGNKNAIYDNYTPIGCWHQTEDYYRCISCIGCYNTFPTNDKVLTPPPQYMA